MNNIQLSGTIAGKPYLMNDGASVRFYLKARQHPSAPGLPLNIVQVPCCLFDASTAQRKILLGGKHRNVRIEASGRLEQIVSDGDSRAGNGHDSRRQHRNLEMIVTQQGLWLQRGR